LIVLQIIGILILAIFNYGIVIGPYGTSRFEPKVWESFRDPIKDCRSEMANDISNRLVKKDMSKQEVFAILGEPDFTKDDKVEYYIGFCGMWDDNGVRIFFDNSDKVKDVYNIQY
jgi:hypothetical protein